MPQLETEVIIRNGRVVGGSSSGVTDVQVNGTSVVNNGVAEIDLSGKQDTLTAGNNIQIAQDGTISATDTTYTAGTGINIDANNVISATGGGGNVDDVYVNGVSVLDSNKIAQIDLTGKVNKTGDTMTGNLVIDNATAGAVQITNPNTDLREADNNVSSAQFNQFRIVDDGSHMTMGYFGTTVYPEGLVQGTLQVSNFDTNGDPVSNGISLTVDKDGSKSYSVSDEAAFRRAIGVVNRAAANAGADLSLVTTGDKYTWNNKVDKSGDTMTGALTMAGKDIYLKTTGSSSDDSGDIVWYYGNGQEKARLWTNDTYTSESGLNFRIYKKDGTSLFSGTIPLRDTHIGTPVSIANGGTGKTTAADARANLATPAMTTETYPALLPTNGSNNWIKVGTSNTSYGLLPSQAGGRTNGHNYLGTSSWYWGHAYIDYVYTSEISIGGTDVGSNYYHGTYDTGHGLAVGVNPNNKSQIGAYVSNAATARSKLGLGSMATQNTGSWEPVHPYLWRNDIRSNMSHPSGMDYWTMPTAFPAKSGYSRIAIIHKCTDRHITFHWWTLNGSNQVVVYTNNWSGSTVKFSLEVLLIYLKDSNKW